MRIIIAAAFGALLGLVETLWRLLLN